MRKIILSAAVIVACLSASYAEDTINWETTISESNAQALHLKARAKQIIKIDILMSEAISVANDAIKSLEKNLYVLVQLETNSEFRQCAIQKDNLIKIQILESSARELFNEREITKSQHDAYLQKTNKAMKALTQKINTQCINKG